MIGVVADPAEHDVVREFFELFKTPWELYQDKGRYDVLLCVGTYRFDATARLVILYGSRKTPIDGEQKNQVGRRRKPTCRLTYQGNRLPIYGETLTFSENGGSLLRFEDSQECAAYLGQDQDRTLVRVGYDLFSEVRTLLTEGQPSTNAGIPALELHIAFLRDVVTACGIPLVEIPPVPEGYRFIACLTHDVDHPSIRQHKWDRTIFGFFYRALFGSLRDSVHGRLPVQGVLKNWIAATKVPLVYTGLAKDFWREFDDRYLELEKGLRSTFFVIPFRNCPGKVPNGPAPKIRAARYAAKDLADTIRKLMAAGCEFGLHGIDAWLDGSDGSKEIKEICSLTGASEIGVRMHWLYYNQQSPTLLEKAGAAYDSTIGYNETVGYRAGTTQVFKPIRASRLLELPMHVMDTALFYPAYLGLSQQGATTLLRKMVKNAVQFGGCLTTNWHDRSLVPERLWGASYSDLLHNMESQGAWFATGAQAVSWFRKRRSAMFDPNSVASHLVSAKVAVDHGDNLPRLRLRIHRPRGARPIDRWPPANYEDVTVNECINALDVSKSKQ
jgi:hypothetical protein